MINLVSICLIDSQKYRRRYINNYSRKKAENMYYIGYQKDDSIGEETIMGDNNLEYEYYKQIVEKHHGYHDNTFDEDDDINKYNFVFNSKKYCEEAIEELQAYIIMITLKGGYIK